jgi:hypothetical protein
MKLCAAIICVSMLAAGTLQLQAQDSFVLYDTFPDGALSPDLWTGAERGPILDLVRAVKEANCGSRAAPTATRVKTRASATARSTRDCAVTASSPRSGPASTSIAPA